MKVVKGVKMTNNFGQEITVNGVLTADSKYIVAASGRSWKGDWKDSANGNKTRPIGFGDICILRADNVKEKDGIVTCEYEHCFGPLGFRSNETQGKSGTIASINTFLTDNATVGKSPKKYAQLLPASVVAVVEDAVGLAIDDLEANGPAVGSTNAKLSGFAKKLANMAHSSDQKAEAKSAPQESAVPATGKTVEEVLP
jgi:hypothetical protein